MPSFPENISLSAVSEWKGEGSVAKLGGDLTFLKFGPVQGALEAHVHRASGFMTWSGPGSDFH